MAGIEAFLILAVTTLHFTIVAWSKGANELVADTQLGGGGLKQSREMPLAVGETISKFKRYPVGCIPRGYLGVHTTS